MSFLPNSLFLLQIYEKYRREYLSLLRKVLILGVKGMKHSIIFILSFFTSVMLMAQSEEAIGRSWLIANGCDGTRLNLKATHTSDELVVLEDTKGGAFVIVVGNRYASVVDNRILAYSVGNIFSNPESSWSNILLNTYKYQLVAMAHKGLHSQTEQGGAMHNTVSPLLGKICWGQLSPYNLKCPEIPLVNSHKPAGCMAIAMAQIMYYYRYPQRGKGTFTYTSVRDVMEKDFSDIGISWDNISPSYSREKVKGEDYSQVASLVEACAVSIASQFANLSTSSNALHARSALVNFWGYSPECRYIQSGMTLLTENTIRTNLEARKPVILSGGEHAFVCDGCKGLYLHYNLGWYGAGNGYYRLVLHPDLCEDDNMPDIISNVVCDIKPKASVAEVSRQVHLSVPGTLQRVLPETKAMSVTRLTITGKMNGEDVRYLRRMLCADDEFTRDKSSGVLSHLDISGVQFVNDTENAYMRIPAKDCKYTDIGIFGGNVAYDFSKMTPEQFHSFQKTNMAKGTGYKFVEEGGRYYIDMFTVSRTLSPCIFAFCNNLKKVILPSSVNKVLGQAFHSCCGLEEVLLPRNIGEVEAGAFSGCFMLRRVITDNPKLKETVHGLFPLKMLSQYGDVTNHRHGGILDGLDIATCDGIYLRKGSNRIKMERLGRKTYVK